MDLMGNYAPENVDVPPVKKNARVKKMADKPPAEKNVMVEEPKRVMPMGVDKKALKKVSMKVSKQSKEIHEYAREHMKPEAFKEIEIKREEMHKRHKHEMKQAKTTDKMHLQHEMHKHLVENELDPIRVRSAIANIRANHKKASEHAIAQYKADVKMAKAELRKELKKKSLSPPSHPKAEAVAEAVAEVKVPPTLKIEEKEEIKPVPSLLKMSNMPEPTKEEKKNMRKLIKRAKDDFRTIKPEEYIELFISLDRLHEHPYSSYKGIYRDWDGAGRPSKFKKWNGTSPHYKGDIVEHKGHLYKAFLDVNGSDEPPSGRWVKL